MLREQCALGVEAESHHLRDRDAAQPGDQASEDDAAEQPPRLTAAGDGLKQLNVCGRDDAGEQPEDQDR